MDLRKCLKNLRKDKCIYGKYDFNNTKSIISRRLECYFTSYTCILYFDMFLRRPIDNIIEIFLDVALNFVRCI